MFKKFTTLKLNSEIAKEMYNLIQSQADVLADYRFASPSASEKSRMGFSFTGIGHDEYVSKLGDDLVIRVTSQGKSINKNEIDVLVQGKKLIWMEENQADSVPKKIEKMLQEDAEIAVIASTFPKAPTHSYMVIRKCGTVYVEGKGKAMEDVVALLRKAIGTMPVIPFVIEDGDIHGMLKSWVQQDINDKIGLGDKATLLAAPLNGGDPVEYKTKGHIGSDPRALAILKDDLSLATEVTINYDGVIETSVSEDMVFSTIKFSNDLTSEAEDLGAGLLLQLTEINKLVNEVIVRAQKAAA
ncbi:putative recombination associated protein [Vibrio phage 501E54-1]|nr:putative recombination associated protein [Vibrio phage 501E54-1]